MKQENAREDQISNGGEAAINFEKPYSVHVEITGTAPIIFHAWNCDSVDAKAKAVKGSKAKKTDDVESFVYRNDKGEICIPGTYLAASLSGIKGAAKFRQDPRSPRKSALDLVKAGVIVTTDLASLGTGKWDYLDRRRVVVQHAGITRLRPAFCKGWKAEFEIMVLLPQYITTEFLQDMLVDAGRLCGLAEMRPTFGRFAITNFKVNSDL